MIFVQGPEDRSQATPRTPTDLGLCRRLTLALDCSPGFFLMDGRFLSRQVTSSEHLPEDFELDNMHDESEQPLIVDENDDGVTSRPEVSKQDANKLIWLLTLSAGLSGLLFGYE